LQHTDKYCDYAKPSAGALKGGSHDFAAQMEMFAAECTASSVAVNAHELQ